MALATPTDPPNSPHASGARLDQLISPECQAQIRAEIAANGGSEVYFIAKLDSRLRVEQVEAWAFGNRRAVPALLQHSVPGDVVLHNHPSGNMEPSDADISVASELGGRGIGSYIVNNDCTALRIIVKAMKRPGLEPINGEVLAGWLKPGGRLAETMDGYEQRPQQGEMLRAVADAFNRDGIAVIEAGTGTGKSLAYLLPSIAWALRNREKVVVSTGTINLQEQLLEKDLPTLLRTTGLKFEATILKGRNNYLCKRKAKYTETHPEFLDLGEKDQQLAEIRAWIPTTREGSRDDLPFTPDDSVWERVMSEGDNCLRTKCPFYAECFYYNARRRAARASVLVVNHHLLMADLSIRAETGNWSDSFVLPPYQRVVLDEAHNLEEVATDYFGARASRAALRYAMRRLVNPRSNEGLLAFIAAKVHENAWPLAPTDRDELIMALGQDLPLRHSELLHAMEEAAGRLADLLDRQSDTPLHMPVEIKRRLTGKELAAEPWRTEADAPLRAVVTAGRAYVEPLREVERRLARFLEDAEPEGATPILELRSAINKVDSVLARVIRFLGDDSGQCRWVEYRRRPESRRGPEVTWCIAPLEVTEALREQLLKRVRSAVMTSATLTVERRFEYFLRRVGADDPKRLGIEGRHAGEASADPEGETAPDGGVERAEEVAPGAPVQREGGAPTALPIETAPAPMPPRPLRALALDNPFDYDRQVYVGVPMDLPEPTERSFEEALCGFLGPALEISRGRALILFTSYALLERVHARLAPGLERLGYPCLRQGQTSRTILTESFRRDVGSILFATSSFWEGVDVQGEALSLLVLTRLPFRVPGEPLMEARVEEMRRRGLDPFHHMIVPQAVIRFRQGFGRLIRSRTDRGAVLICDRRVATKSYGRMFLHSLPTRNVQFAGQNDVHASMARFFEAETREP